MEENMNKIITVLVILLWFVNLSFCKEEFEQYLIMSESTNISELVNAYYGLKNFSTNEIAFNKMIRSAQNIFRNMETGKFSLDGESYIQILDELVKLHDKRALPAIIAGSGLFGGGGIKKGVLVFSNEVVPYLIEAMKDKNNYSHATGLAHWLINDTNCVLTEIEKENLKIAILIGYYKNHYTFNEPWLSSIILRLTPTDEEINKYKLLKSIESFMTNSDNTILGWVPGNLTKIKDKKIKLMLVPVVKKGHEIRLIKKINFDEKKFKAGLKKGLSLAQKDELYNKRKSYLEGERQKVITELSNTLVELEKE
jgi:uncharacterized protein YnzC (UPF0291/DUF896 family)